MNIDTNSLYAQMQSMSLGNSSVQGASFEKMGNNLGMGDSAIPALNKSTSNFGDMLKDAVNNVNDIQKESGAKKIAFEMGDRSVTLADTMVASAKAGIAFDATVQVRNKFVEAYKEIMNMPV
ncbi:MULTISPECIES: flagellar hook-basal body complex protein FliE [unclassified Colwellia]|jgi:flagellar hook-basal body complex protein FliE|uniref:flagellar hook-basal body complex protein FliE n=1 Tax=unclassified Colwellia TaxID=196834 RepID=UPI0015F3FEC2|nr:MULTISPECIES: flagellar hook-basal body complex protein FliE [unclassified Colwellia]MBA6335741.1 flagellar hook-basal body complex protein FliE [Colwellia sp. BRX8-7]MBA6379053.1 flagellar hook-basal body complex protein FliE [Colwellia sp. BRX10-7]MBA6387225.1 flagellar hook-basal body complex protein FliE [Colwellia sp. BRX10-2]MBA6400098.1 flagellar hook-basal body complex protein FliE [Colwellia sp. BRX10-5]MBA6403977.1 flagellar hook-basal body complex protein FliE [Colwellia sp. BRX1